MAGFAPPMEGNPVYDPEIKDIADYVHNKPIDSELAVSWNPRFSLPKFRPVAAFLLPIGLNFPGSATR